VKPTDEINVENLTNDGWQKTHDGGRPWAKVVGGLKYEVQLVPQHGYLFVLLLPAGFTLYLNPRDMNDLRVLTTGIMGFNVKIKSPLLF
jgi:hypothetical protein